MNYQRPERRDRIALPPGQKVVLAARMASDLVWTRPRELAVTLKKRLGLLGFSFLLVVIVPTVCTFFYLLLIASDEYVSEARFAVRSASEPRPVAISDALSMLSNFTGSRSTAQDAFIIADYIRSRTIIEDLGGKEQIYDIYSKRSIDWISRLPRDESLEEVWYYWRHKISAIIDTQSSILTLNVRAFSAEDAKRLAERIVQRSEILVNAISERSRRDALSRAESEVQLSLERLAKIRAAMLDFRNRASTIDPASSAISISETLTLLTREKLGLENNRTSLRGSLDEDSPVMRFLSQQIESIDRQIEAIKESLTSQSQNPAAISGQIADYEDLQLQSQFAEKLFEIAKASFERARVEQEKQQLYLATVVRPTMPGEATFPRPFTGSAVIFALCLVIWSMVSLVIASISDHVG